jgi:fatty-acyl-CoA synthase
MVDLSKTLYANLRSTAERHPNDTAFTFLDARLRPTHYTYQALFERADWLAKALETRALDASAPFGVLLQSQEAQVVHYLAALSLGLTPAILTPPNRKLNREYHLETVRAVAEYCRFSAIVIDVEGLDLDATLLEAWSLREIRRGTGCSPARVKNAALLQFSSGTTGIKRGVLVSDEAALLQLKAYAEATGLRRDDRILSWLPLYHDMGFIACLNLPLVFGVHCIMMRPLDWVARPAMYLQAASAYRATLGWNPNFAYAFMAERVRREDLKGVQLETLRGLVNCSEPVTHESQRRFVSKFSAYGLRPDVFWGCYAMAETTFALTHGLSSDGDYLDYQGPARGAPLSATLPLISVGRPIAGAELVVVDEQARPQPDRVLGEIWVKSPFNFAGYYNNPEATANAFHEGWYRTGDIGYRVGNEFFVCSRKKDLLIVAGVNIFPQDIEDLVSDVEGVHAGRVAVFAEFDPKHQTEKVIVLAESSLPESEQIDALVRLRQRLLATLQIANFEVHLVSPGWLIKSSAGKMARKANRDKWAASRRVVQA